MQIELHEVFIREVVEGYVDCAEEGVFGYCGKLNIRPKYQREFIDTMAYAHHVACRRRHIGKDGRRQGRTFRSFLHHAHIRPLVHGCTEAGSRPRGRPVEVARNPENQMMF